MTIFGKIVFGLLGVVIASGIFYSVTSYVKTDTVITPPKREVPLTELETGDAQAPSKKIAFSDFVKQGGSYTCTVTGSSTDATSTRAGIVYIKDNLVKATIGTSVTGKGKEVVTLIRDGYIYVWNGADATKGSKSKVKDVDASTSTESSTLWNGYTIDDYSCDAWDNATDTIFLPPKEITFKEI